MNLALNCWFYQCYNTTTLNAKLSPFYFCLLFNIQFIKNNNKIYCWQQGLSANETGDAIGFRQQLSMTSYEAMSCRSRWIILCTRTENGSFIQNLTSWSVLFWLVLLTEHEVLHCYATNVRSPDAWLPNNVSVLRILFSRLSMLPTCQPLSGNSLSVLRASYCFDK